MEHPEQIKSGTMTRAMGLAYLAAGHPTMPTWPNPAARWPLEDVSEHLSGPVHTWVIDQIFCKDRVT